MNRGLGRQPIPPPRPPLVDFRAPGWPILAACWLFGLGVSAYAHGRSGAAMYVGWTVLLLGACALALVIITRRWPPQPPRTP